LVAIPLREEMGAVRRGEESTIKCLTEARESSEDLGGLLAILARALESGGRGIHFLFELFFD